MVAELLGWFGAGLSCVVSLPQVVRTMRAKRLDGISSATYWLVLANAAAWTGWSLLTGEYAAGVPALVNGPAAIVILHRLLATRHTARRRKFDTSLIRRAWQVAFSRVFVCWEGGPPHQLVNPVRAAGALDLAVQIAGCLLSAGMSANDVVVVALRITRTFGLRRVHFDVTYRVGPSGLIGS